MKRKPILCLDFDGVIHGYQSGWRGAAVIPDPPVPGALEFIVGALEHFEVHILSSRSHRWGGRRAMKHWLRNQLVKLAPGADVVDIPNTPEWWYNRICETAFADPWCVEVWHAADLVVRQIKWPWLKPPALVTIDDRALTFSGTFPTMGFIRNFRPWTKPDYPMRSTFAPQSAELRAYPGFRFRINEHGVLLHEKITP